jgi:hypothetical protein
MKNHKEILNSVLPKQTYSLNITEYISPLKIMEAMELAAKQAFENARFDSNKTTIDDDDLYDEFRYKTFEDYKEEME